MKQISYEDWLQKFDLARPVDDDPSEYSDDERESLTFFDNGAVRNSEGEFIIKADQVRAR